MSHDFPDGPEYNPEPIDDDPWDAPEAHPEVEPWCSIHGHMVNNDRFCISCGAYIPASDATGADLRPSDA